VQLAAAAWERLNDSTMDNTAIATFFDGYVRSLLQAIVDDDMSEWRAYLHPEFLLVNPAGGGWREDGVIHEWRGALRCGAYHRPAAGNLQSGSIQGLASCNITLCRCYFGWENYPREMLQLQAVAEPVLNGVLRVRWHNYTMLPPKLVRGVPACSQVLQDLWVIHRLAGLERGFFLDIGANHPTELSNTYLLEKAFGWSGLCIDPFPVGDWSIRSAELARVALGPDGGKLKFVAPGNVLGGLVDHVDMPRVEMSIPAEHRPIVEVETALLRTILGRAKQGSPAVIHYLSLDTEGSELDILRQFPFETCVLCAVSVEHNYKEPARSQIRQLLESQGMVLDVRIEHDDFYLRKGYQGHIGQLELDAARTMAAA